jgi:hypothetical protein
MPVFFFVLSYYVSPKLSLFFAELVVQRISITVGNAVQLVSNKHFDKILDSMFTY